MSNLKTTTDRNLKSYFFVLTTITTVLSAIAVGVQYLYATNYISEQPASVWLFLAVFVGFLFFIMALSHPRLSFLNEWKF